MTKQNSLLLACSLCLMSFTCAAVPFDSLRLETINGKQYIIHQVDAKETLYSISRRYRVPVNDLAQENPSAGSGISIGQLLRVPYIVKTKPRSTESGNTVHKVAAKETLFSISRLYGVSVDELKNWNNLKDNALNIGQDLLIQKKTLVAETKPVEIKPTEVKAGRGTHKVAEKETLFSIAQTYGTTMQQLRTWNNLASDEVKPGQIIYVIQPITEAAQTPAPEIKNTLLVIGSEEIHEKGMALLMEISGGDRKYLAQHKTAKPGTIMKVRNESTQREVFVRVVSVLNPTEDALVKISKSAYDKLGATDARFPVEIIRFK
ncbi:MAG: LysM peptidoglycan-binding domain-containing protein [Bacteroidetes bacterium]|nr:LysM peptidoglycan-binding domain-containing protein [Bacteroidota bacterium]